ncbi:MAG: hypothetical protein VZQ29_03670 [Succiniclasticum sp.]|nr:hypothetical protein [Succiniclasticum sp.]
MSGGLGKMLIQLGIVLIIAGVVIHLAASSCLSGICRGISM